MRSRGPVHSLVDAELVALRVLHDRPGAAGLVDRAQDGGAEGLQPFHGGVAGVGAGVEVEVEAVLGGLRLGDLLEEQAAAEAGAADRVEGLVGVADSRPGCARRRGRRSP